MATNNLATTAAAAAAPNEEDKVRNMVMSFAFQKVRWQISTANTYFCELPRLLRDLSTAATSIVTFCYEVTS